VVTLEEDANAPFDPAHPDDRVTDWNGSPAEYRPGPAGLCWHNAREVARSAPDEYLYAEGIAWNHDEWSGHAWVVRKSDCAVIECTSGYHTSKRYRGICLEVVDVENFIDGQPLVDGKTCRELWHTTNADGSIRSEAPGVLAILVAEARAHRLDLTVWWRQQNQWLDRGKCCR
jgi:hypothetical protein